MIPRIPSFHHLAWLLLGVLGAAPVRAQLAVEAGLVMTMSGVPITNGVVLVDRRRITAVGPAGTVAVPAGWRRLRAAVVTPGFIDAHTVLGLSGILNVPHDQDQLEKSGPLQPELRAIDAYNPREPLIDWVRQFGVTTLHTGHGPGAVLSGQTMIVKTHGRTVDEAVIVPAAMVAGTFGSGATSGGDKSPGTRSKVVAMLRIELIKAQEYARKAAAVDAEKRPARDLRLETLGRVLERRLPILLTVQRAADIEAALRLAEEFGIRLVLDGVAEAPEVLPLIQRSGFPVILNPTMTRAKEETENIGFDNPARLKAAGVLFALQSGYENYVPKTRVVLFEAGFAAGRGLSREAALASITRDAATILGLADRLGTLTPGKDADLALFDGDPLEFTTHCLGVVIDGEWLPGENR